MEKGSALKHRYLLSGVVLLLFLSVSFASSPTNYTFFLRNGIAIGAIILMASAFIVAIAYMLAALLSLDKLKAWAKQESVEVLFSFILLVCIIPFVVAANHVAASIVQLTDPAGYNMFCAGNGPSFTYTIDHKPIDFGYNELPCHMRVARDYLNSIFYEAATTYEVIGTVNSIMYYIAHVSVTLNTRGVGLKLLTGAVNTMPLAFYTTKSNFYAFVSKYLVRILVILRFQEVFLQFIATALFPVFLCIGIAARSFPFTRRIGGLLIAVALCLYFVYPMFYVLGDYTYYSVAYGLGKVGLNQHPNPAKQQVIAPLKYDYSLGGNGKPTLHQPKLDTDLNTIAQKSMNNDVKIGTGTMNYLSNLDRLVKEKENSAPLSPAGVTTGLMNKILALRLRSLGFKSLLSPHAFYQNMEILDILACLMFFSTFFSFFAVIGTIASIKVLSPMLGGDTEIAGLTRLI